MPTYITNTDLAPIDRVRAAHAAAQTAQISYWCAIDEAVAAGHSQREVSAACGMSHTGVGKVVERLYREGRSLLLERVKGRWIVSPPDGRSGQNLPPYDRDPQQHQQLLDA